MTATTTLPPYDPAVGPPNRWRVLWILSLALLIVVIDITVLQIAVPQMAEDLRPSSTELLWTIDIYPLVAAPLLLASSTLADRIGRKRVLISGLVLFTCASAFAAFAWSPEALIGARALQGVGGAMVMPNTMAMIRAVFPNRRERARAIGVWSAVLSAAGAAGPLLGGVLVENFWWGAVFLINVPVLLLVLPFAIRGLPESRHSNPPPWDNIAVLLGGLAVLLLAFGIKEGARNGMSEPLALGTLAGSLIFGITFVRRQLHSPRPVLDVRLFKRPVFAVAVGSILLSLISWVGLELFLAQYLQFVLGLRPSVASLWLMPCLGAMFVSSLIAASFLNRVGHRITLGVGFAVSGLSMVPLFWLGEGSSFWLFAMPFVVMGFATSIVGVASNDTVMSSVSADDAGQAAAIEATSYDLGGGIGVAILGSVGAAVYTHGVQPLPGLDPARQREVTGSVTEAYRIVGDLPRPMSQALFQKTTDAWLSAFHIVLGMSVGFMLLGALAWALVYLHPATRREAAALREGGGHNWGDEDDDQDIIIIGGRELVSSQVER
jgi:DHA2 family multidrug resistance protein-like MFS transporter